MVETNGNSEEVLKDAGMVQSAMESPAAPVQAADEPPTVTPQVEINPLAEAMREFNKAKSEAAQAAVSVGDETETTEPAADERGTVETPGEQGGDTTQQPDTAPVQGDGAVATQPASDTQVIEQTVPGEPGGPATEFEPYDAQAGIAEVRQELVGITQDAVRKEFAKQDKKKININDLVKVNEQNGTKEFINPDTNRPFTSSNPRSEAAAFVRDFNAGLDAEFAQACQELYPQVEGSYKPMIEFRQFLPRWQQMDEFRQNMFEDAVAGLELRDRQGTIVGYNADLNAIADQMERQIQFLLRAQQSISGTGGEVTQPATAPTENPVTQPAVAAKTVSNTAAGKEEKKYDLSNMADSLAYYNKQKKQKGN